MTGECCRSGPIVAVRDPSARIFVTADAVAAVAASRISATAVPGLGLLRIDPQSIGASLLGTTGQDGRCSFAVPLPLQPSLAGLEVYWQGVVVTANGLRLTGLLIDRLLP